MKNILNKISIAVLLFVLALSLTACSFVKTEEPEEVVSDTMVLAQNVEFNKDGSATEELSLADAVAKVERTSVAIYTNNSAGSGVIVDMRDSTKPNDDYVYVITCHHVIEGKGPVQVIIPDEKCSYENEDYIFSGSIGNDTFADVNAVTLVGGDKDSDIAVLRIDLSKNADSGKKLSADKIVKASVPTEYSVKKGESIFAIGNPTGVLPGSVSDGIVSYIEREVFIDSIGNMSLLQISVTTNPGNSGGGLYNLKGELIGITNAGNTSYDAINFAIPAVLSNGNGFISISAQLLGSQTDTNYGYISGRKEKFGFTVVQEEGYVGISVIVADSIAEGAGLRVNDKIDSIKVVSVDNPNNVVEKNVSTLEDFSSVMNNVKIGDTITIYVSRVSGFDVVRTSCNMVAKQYRFCDTGK